MTLRDRRREEDSASSFGKLLRDAASDRAPSGWERDGFERLSLAVGRLAQSAVGRFRWRQYALVAAAFAVIASGLWLSTARSHTRALAFKVEGMQLSNPNYVVAPPQASARLKFTDGSSVDLAPTARLRVQQLTAHGATVVLERGRAMTHVVHRAGTQWKMLAGPFEISVVGTQFQTVWDPASEALAVELYEGSLLIDGQGSGESATLHKGQRFQATGRQANWSISPIAEVSEAKADGVPTSETAQSSPESVDPIASATPAAPLARTGSVPGSVSRPAASGWASAMAKGEFSRVVSEAEDRGFSNCLDQCSVSDVRYLADAARYTRRFEQAEQALGALRRRAPGEAPAAAYLLGALNESQGRSMAALRWYEQSVAEAPTGRVVSEAQAGRLRMLVATKQFDAARAAARQYLSDYPHGVGKTVARKVLDTQ
jgi:hypothetical protein